MATSVLSWRAAVFCRTLNQISTLKPVSSLISKYGLVLQTACYNPKPLKRNIRDPYIPDKDSETTPEWQKTARYYRKLFGRYGSASGIDPASLWPTHEELDKIIAEEKEWHPTLKEMQKNIAAREKEAAEKRLAREKLIAANMAKMPKMIEDWRREKREAKLKAREEKARRNRILVEAREQLGYNVDHRSPKVLELMEEMEKAEKKKMKQAKKQQKLEQMTEVVTPPAAAS